MQTELKSLDQVFREYAQVVLAAKNGNRTHTARTLGISVRTLQRNLIRWGLQDQKRGGA